MRRRIYWLLPDLASARRTMNDLLLARIAEQHIHFVAREDADMSGLHAANVLQTSDVIRAAEMGLIIGGGVGVVAGVIATPFHERYSTAEQLRAMQATIPMNRLGSAEDCAGTFLYLASDALSGYVTGQIIEVNGGQYMP